MLACMLLVFLGFVALGTWQVKRLFWKLDLIARVDQRVHAPAVAAPAVQDWPDVNADGQEYLHVRVNGVYLYQYTVKVQAATDLGAGYWLLTPLRAEDGALYLINRGYVTAEGALADRQRHQGTVATSASALSVSGLLRISEPGGGFLRHNDAAADRWFSRDVQAIAARHQLNKLAPYFIDAAADPADAIRESQMLSAGEPIAGLTVIAFRNSHLVYAFTLYALALMTAGACFLAVRDEKRQRQAQADSHAQDNEDGKQG